ncbi:MAG: TlpA family protein disulfide reductase [Burkholderiales bacterium]|nr:TlpA family protein disulfide reductase [Burkholderiales bacterium]
MTKQASNAKKMILIALVSIAVIAGLFVFSSLNQHQAAPAAQFKNIKGEQLSITAMRGKVLVVNFWATSCATCIKEMPEMIHAYERFHAQGLEFVAIAMRYDPPNYVLNFTETRGLPFHVALDVDGSLARAFGDVTLTPTTFLIDRQGQLIKRYVGMPDFVEFQQLLESELAKS